MRTRLILTSCCLLGCAAPTSHRRAETADPRCAAVTQRYVQKEDFSGVVVMARGGKELCRATAGDGIEASTSFPIASLTKQMVSVAVLRAEQQKRLKLDDDVGPMLGHAHALRLIDLMNHTSGLADFTKSPGFLERRAAPANATELWEIVRTRPLRFEPGAKFEYCNSNYLAVGLVLEHVYGEPLEVILQREVFAPAGMRASTVNRPPDPQHTAVGFEVRDDPDYRPEPVGTTVTALYQGAGGVAATADDLLRFADSLLEGSHRAQLDEVRALAAAPSAGPNMTYALGWLRSTLSGHEVLWHTGSLPGFSHRIMLVPDENLVLIALSNHAEASLGRAPKSAMGDDLFRALLGEGGYATAPRSAQVLAPDEVTGLAGSYVAPSPALRFEVDVSDRQVYLRVLGGDGKTLSPRRRIDRASHLEFFFPRLIDAQVRFERDDPSRVDRLVFTQGSEVITATRER